MADLIRKRLISYVVEISPPSFDSSSGFSAAPAQGPENSHGYEVKEPPRALSECSRRVMDFRITKRKQSAQRSSAARRDGQRDQQTQRSKSGTRGGKKRRDTSDVSSTNKKPGKDSHLKSEEGNHSGGQFLEVKQVRKKSRSDPPTQLNCAEVSHERIAEKSYRQVLLRGRN